jgi:dolichyl-phosphate-mannose-protein mannosyltransferase
MEIASYSEQIAVAPSARLAESDWYELAGGALLCVVLVLVVFTFRGYGISWDEHAQNTYGEHILSFYDTGFADRTAVTPDDETDDGNLPYYGGAFDLPTALINRVSPLGTYETRHLLNGLVGLFGLFVTWRLACRVSSDRAGLLALALLATTPAYYGHMFINPKDIPFAVALMALLFLYCIALEEWPRPKSRTVVALGAAGGLALGTRVGAVVSAVDLAIPLALWTAAAWRREGAKSAFAATSAGIVRLFAALPLAYVIMGLLWPWAVQSIANPLQAIRMFARFPFESNILFQGVEIPAVGLPWNYLLTFLAITLPESMLVGLVLAVGAGLRWVGTGARNAAGTKNLQLLAITTAALFPIVYFVVARPTAYNGLRHFLFVLPPLAVLAAIAVDRAFTWLGTWPRRGLVALLLLSMTMAVARMWAMHPLEYIYFNDLSGGLRAAAGRFELDYWGVSVGETTRKLAAKLARRGDATPPQPWRVAVYAAHVSASYFMPPFMKVVEGENEATADFIIDLCPCDSPPSMGTVLARTKRSGIDLSVAYDVRDGKHGRDVSLAPGRGPGFGE